MSQSVQSPLEAEHALNALEVDDAIIETDSSYGDEISSYTASLTSSVNEFVSEYGRTYHSFREFGGSAFPSDERESDRLDLFHATMLSLLDGKLHWAPIGPTPQRVLDVGTGTGIWAIDFADVYPSAEVIGSDLTPIQPTNVPPNLKFIIDDIEDEWAYETHPFDYIHVRYLASCLNNWPHLIDQAYKSLQPGGWIEIQDWDCMPYSADDSLTDKHALDIYHKTSIGRRNAAGYDCRPGPNLEKWVKEAGFVNIKARKLPLPIGAWPKDKTWKQIGVWNYLQFEAGMEGIAIGCLAKTPGEEKAWTMDEINVLVAQARADMKNPKVHAQYDFYVVYAQKPE